MLLTYKKEVYDLFELIADNKNYLDELYFLHKLGYLNIHNTDVLLEGKAAGTYQDFNTRIDLASKMESVIYHELVHFVDFSIKDNTSTTLYKCDGKIDVYEAVPNIPDGCNYVSVPYSNYITEAGAESFTSKYFTKNVTSYIFGTYYLEALEYIYGSNVLNKWYYYFLENLKKEINYENYNNYLVPIIVNDKMYLSWSVWNDSSDDSAVVWINYDFDNDKVNDYVVIEK